MRLNSALVAGCFGLLALATASAQPAPAPDNHPPVTAAPGRQLSFEQSGIRLDLGAVVFGQGGASMTLIVTNENSTPVYFAALSGRKASGLQAVLSDESGTVCIASSSPAAIAELPHLAREPKPQVASMTTIPARSRMNAVFRFSDCRISRGAVSFSGEFALSRDGRIAELVTVPFWGIAPKAASR